MRTSQAWTALGSVLALLSLAAVAAAQSGRASVGYDAGGGEYFPSGGAPYTAGPYYTPDWSGPHGVPGAGFQQPFAPMPPQALYPPQAPGTMTPWPEVSPFYPPNVSYTQHKQNRGLWFKEAVTRNREYDFGIEYIQTSFKQPRDTLIGSAHQPTAGYSNGGSSFGPVGQVIHTYGLGPAQPLDTVFGFPGAFPFPFVRQSATARLATLLDYIYPIHNLGALYGDSTSDGVKLRYGFTNEDGTGWNATGFLTNQIELGFQRGTDNINGIPITQGLLAQSPNLIAVYFGGLPLIYTNDPLDGRATPLGYLGESQKFDVMYRLEYDTKAGGAELNRFLGYWYKGENTRVSTFAGARYFYLNEHFGFHGIDSGFGYDFDLPTGNTPDPDDLHPSGTLIFDYPLLHARLNSDVESHMAGPQVGFRVDVGHRGGFHLWTQTTFALLANHERLQITGDNIGVASFAVNPDMHDGFQFLDNSFRDNESHTHASPLFEQSIIADVKLSGLLPFLRKNYFLENTEFRAGYTFTWVGEVSRPGDSINWVGYPLYPSVRIERHSFWMNQLNLGLNFCY